MTTNPRWRAGDERGAVLVHVAVAMLALIGFSALAIDYGAFWVSRRQAQNAADAAALAGALSLAFDDPDDIPRAQAGAAAAGAANQVFGAPPSIVAATDVLLVPCPPGAPGLPDTCIRANVYRSAERLNALPTFFAQIFDINSQDVRATATAQVRTANAVECMKPWAIADKWDENWETAHRTTAPWTPDVQLRQVQEAGQRLCARSCRDDAGCVHPANGQRSGNRIHAVRCRWQSDRRLRASNDAQDRQLREPPLAGWFLALDLPNEDGVQRFGRQRLPEQHQELQRDGLPDWRHAELSSEQGNMIGPTRQGVEGGGPGGMGLTEKDPGASWNVATRSVQGSCAPGVCADGIYYARSPRIVPVPLFNLDDFFAGSPNGKTTVTSRTSWASSSRACAAMATKMSAAAWSPSPG